LGPLCDLRGSEARLGREVGFSYLRFLNISLTISGKEVPFEQ
jgi:hypothetical protein